MKKALMTAGGALAGPCLAYLWFAFGSWDLNPANWGGLDRFFVGFLALVLGWIGAALAQLYSEH